MKNLIKVSTVSLVVLAAMFSFSSIASADRGSEHPCPNGTVVIVGGTETPEQACMLGGGDWKPGKWTMNKGFGGNNIMERTTSNKWSRGNNMMERPTHNLMTPPKNPFPPLPTSTGPYMPFPKPPSLP